MSQYRLSRAEQEVIIRWDAEERIAHIDAAYPPIVAKLDKLAEQFPDTYICTSFDSVYGAKRYSVPAKHIAFRKPPTEAQKRHGQQAADRLRAKAAGVPA